MIYFLGMTNFDLLGDFGQIEWLVNFKLVLLYNIIFASAAVGCLGTKVTSTVLREIYARLRNSFLSIFGTTSRRRPTSHVSAKED